jgi:hypothetical protein
VINIHVLSRGLLSGRQSKAEFPQGFLSLIKLTTVKAFRRGLKLLRIYNGKEIYNSKDGTGLR